MESQKNQSPTTNIIPASLLNPLCAWCLAEANEDPGEGSHGICEEHAQQILDAWRAERAAHSVKPMA